MVIRENVLLGLGLMLAAGEIPWIAGAFGLDTSTKSNFILREQGFIAQRAGKRKIEDYDGERWVILGD